MSYCTCAQVAGSTKLRKKIGLLVANRTIGTFSSPQGHTDANRPSTNMNDEEIAHSGVLCTTAQLHPLDLLGQHVSEFTYNRTRKPPSPRAQCPEQIGS